ncbi:MAG: response regulator, partial [Bacteroidales bacterium]
NWTNEHFLIADDDYYSYLLIEKILRKTGAKVDYVSNGADALNKIVPNSTYTVVILDILMPKLSGFEVIEAARAIRPDIKFIAYSADVLNINKKKCMNVGFHACIVKPSLPSKLMDTLKEVLILRSELS